MRADTENRKVVGAGVSDGPRAGIELRTWPNPQLEPRDQRGSLMFSCAKDRSLTAVPPVKSEDGDYADEDRPFGQRPAVDRKEP